MLDKIERLLMELDSAHVEVREAALQQIRALPPSELLRLTQMEGNHWRQRRRLLLLRTTGMLGLPLMLYNLSPLIGAENAILLLLLSPFALLYNVFAGLPNPSHRALATLLGEMQDPRFIGPAVEMLTDTNVKVSNTNMRGVERALRRMVRQLRADQANLLSRDQKRALRTLLQTPYADFELIEGILKALEQVGDEHDIPVVEKLATQGVTRVRRSAEECLVFLRQRAEFARQSQTLLRPTLPTNDTPDALLRPVQTDADNTPAEQLLRPQILR